MLKKIILLVASLAIISIAFMIYQWRESLPAPAGPIVDQPSPATRPTRPRSTQPVLRVDDRQGRNLDSGSMKIPPGESARIRVFDEKTGDTKYVFQATRWEPVGASGLEFAVVEPTAEVSLPGGQKAYLRADSGQIIVARGARSTLDPKRGSFKGNVRIIVDRTSPQWRKDNPDSADPIQHPEAVIKFWLDDVRFDLELASLESDGPLRMQSADGTLEGRGLKLLWNEVNRRITELRITEGKQATLRSSGLMGFGAAGRSKPAKGHKAATQPATADAEQPKLANDVKARPGAVTLVDVQNRPNRPKANRVDAYNLVFNDHIVAEQRDGMKTVGKLNADIIKVLFEVGQSEREAAQYGSGSRPASEPAPKERSASAPADDHAPLENASSVVINWTGELLITPEEEKIQEPSSDENKPKEQKTGAAERMHLIAIGNPVEIFSGQTGNARCKQLEYHHETEQVTLTGTPESPVQMGTGADRELYGEKIFFDGKTGLARVDGPGKLVSSRQMREDEPELPECIVEALRKQAGTQPAAAKAASERPPRVLSWQKSARIQFGIAKIQIEDPATHEMIAGKGGEYLKQATFEGCVSLIEPKQSMAAEHVEIFFREPQAPTGPAAQTPRDKAVADRILASGQVHMTSESDRIDCDALDVTMTVDETGNNVPSVGRATGNVVARQNNREIRARDEIVVNMGSAPKQLAQEERRRLEAAARECGFSPESPEWKAFEAKRRQTIITAVAARGDVTVLDPTENLDVAAERLDCSLNDKRQITNATVKGTTETPAHVQTKDFYIRGANVFMDLPTQSAEVPGAGLLLFYTPQDLDGRRMDQPIPVVVTWGEQMSLDGKRNTGTFKGSIKVRSEKSLVDCQRLNLDFEDLVTTSTQPAGAGSVWILRPLLNSLARKNRSNGMAVSRVSGQLRKRLANMRASGEAIMATEVYDESSTKGLIGRWATALTPSRLRALSKSPQADQHRRLLSGVQVSGPEIVVNLLDQHITVEGKGELRIRDYHMPERRSAGQQISSASPLASLSTSSLTNYSPGHTLFTWQTSMSFFNQQNKAVFDRAVRMQHWSGSELQVTPELAAATGLDAKALAAVKGRKVSLTSDRLIAEFDRDKADRPNEPGALSKANKLKGFSATGQVHMQEGGRSLDGEEVIYDDKTGIVRAVGTPQLPPQAMDIDEHTGTLRAAWRGKSIEWNTKTQKVRVSESVILAPGR